MTMKAKPHHKIRTIRSLHDLELEKSRLKLEAVKREEGIKRNYSNLVDALTFRNLLQQLSHEISMTTSAVSTAFSVGKSIFKFLKKKKKNKVKTSEPTSPQPDENKIEE
jgi:hypothetical protein